MCMRTLVPSGSQLGQDLLVPPGLVVGLGSRQLGMADFGLQIADLGLSVRQQALGIPARRNLIRESCLSPLQRAG